MARVRKTNNPKNLKIGVYKSILSLLLMVISLIGCNDDNPEAKKGSTVGFLWKATYNGNTAYFLGTSLYGQEDFYPLSDSIYDALYTSNQVYVELAPENFTALNNQLGTLIRDENDNFEDSITGEYKGQLINIIGRNLYDQAILAGIETYFYASLISRQIVPPSASATLSINNAIITLALQSNLPLRSLDEVADQVAVQTFQDDDTFDNQVRILKSVIDEFDDTKVAVEKIFSAYKAGEVNEFEEFAVQEKITHRRNVVNGENYWDISIVNRNEKWAAEIARLLQENDNRQYLIVAETLHWFGEDNVMIKLKSKLPDITIEKVTL